MDSAVMDSQYVALDMWMVLRSVGDPLGEECRKALVKAADEGTEAMLPEGARAAYERVRMLVNALGEEVSA